MKTSVWLPDDVAEQWKERGTPLAELVRRGLAAGEPEPLDEKIRRIVSEEVEGLLFSEGFAARLARIVREQVAQVAAER